MSDSNGAVAVLETVGQVLLRCFIMGFVLLLFWWVALLVMGDMVFGIHAKLMPAISRYQFEAIHYAGMLGFKAAIFILFFFPYVSIRLVLKKTGG